MKVGSDTIGRVGAFDISKSFNGVWHAGLLHKLKSYGISGQIFGQIFLIFSVIDNFCWFLIGSLYKNIQLMLEFLKAPFLVLHFSYYTIMAFLMILSVILLSMLMILLSTLSVIRHLICGNKWNWLLNLKLIYKALWTGTEIGLLISILETWLLLCDQSNKTYAIDVKMDGSILEEKIIF